MDGVRPQAKVAVLRQDAKELKRKIKTAKYNFIIGSIMVIGTTAAVASDFCVPESQRRFSGMQEGVGLRTLTIFSLGVSLIAQSFFGVWNLQK